MTKYHYSDGTTSHEIDHTSKTLHREDGPAIESAGEYYWYHKGELHREDGPAIEYEDEYREWYLNGRLHRTDGPAIYIDSDGSSDGSRDGWYLEGEEFFEREYNEIMQEVSKMSLEVRLTDPREWVRKLK